MQPVAYYDPTTEKENSEQVAAAHWECLRRNPRFRDVAGKWIASPEFRKQHSLTTDYHHPSIHTARCALDWTLQPPDRVELFKHQAASLCVFRDVRFNFGPMLLERQLPHHKLQRNNAQDFMQAIPLPDAPAPITIDQAWPAVSSQFKAQFRFAVQPPVDFEVLTEWARNWSIKVRTFAGALGRELSPEDKDKMAGDLMELGVKLNELSEIYKLVAIPNSTYSRRGMDAVLKQVENVFSSIGQLVSDKKYNAHKSYFGTTDDWRWFLEAEARGLDIRKTADLYELARAYSEHLRQTAPGQRRPNVKTGGFRGTKVSSQLLRNRRATVRAHIQKINGWINKIYPLPDPIR